MRSLSAIFLSRPLRLSIFVLFFGLFVQVAGLVSQSACAHTLRADVGPQGLRNQADPAIQVSKFILPGDEFMVLRNSGGWSRIRVISGGLVGQEGYIPTLNISIRRVLGPNAGPQNLRDLPDPANQVGVFVIPGDEFIVLGVRGGWSLVRLVSGGISGREGYIPSASIAGH